MSLVLVSAGDASGDLHAAAFVEALRRLRPEARFCGLGGEALAAAGVEIRVPQREIAVGGLVEVLPSVRRVFRAWGTLGRLLAAPDAGERPGLAVLVDAPDFHLPLAKRARRAGVPVLYYVSPQVWAWRRRRIRTLARRVDRLAAIFPFEPALYAGTGLRVDFVGHPLVDPLAALARRLDGPAARATLGLPADPPLVLLLPGSRRNELAHHLGVMLESARALHARRPDVRFVLAVAPTLARDDVAARIAQARLPVEVVPSLVEGRAHEAILAADVVLAKPGTSTIEVALLARPLVVVGRANALTAALARRLVALPSLVMPNLIAGGPVVPELLQHEARPERVAAALEALLGGPARSLVLERLAAVRTRLGRGGASERTAAIAAEMLG